MFENTNGLFNTTNPTRGQQNNSIQQIVSQQTTDINKNGGNFNEVIDISNSLMPTQKQLDYERQQAETAVKKEKNRKKKLYIALVICSLLLIVGAILLAIAINKHNKKIKKYEDAKSISETDDGIKTEDDKEYQYIKKDDTIEKYEIKKNGDTIEKVNLIESFDNKKTDTIKALEGVGSSLVSAGGAGIGIGTAKFFSERGGGSEIEQLIYKDAIDSYKDTIEAKQTVHEGTNDIRKNLSEGFRDSIDQTDGKLRGNFAGAKLFLNGLIDYNEYALKNGIQKQGQMYSLYQASKEKIEKENNKIY